MTPAWQGCGAGTEISGSGSRKASKFLDPALRSFWLRFQNDLVHKKWEQLYYFYNSPALWNWNTNFRVGSSSTSPHPCYVVGEINILKDLSVWFLAVKRFLSIDKRKRFAKVSGRSGSTRKGRLNLNTLKIGCSSGENNDLKNTKYSYSNLTLKSAVM